MTEAPQNATEISKLDKKDKPDTTDRLLNIAEDGTLTQLLASSLATEGPAGKDATSLIGDIKIWLTEEIPEGWLILNGSAFDKAQYPKLFEFLKNDTLPDWRDHIPRGAGNLIKLGERQEDALQNATGAYKSFATYHMGGGVDPNNGESEGALFASGDAGYGFNGTPNQWATDKSQRYFMPCTLNFDLSKSKARTSDETRVKAIGVNFIIKAA